MTKARNIANIASDGSALADGTINYTDVSGTPTLATVATTGAYADVTGTPTLATVATSGAYADVTGTPTLATVATTGAYADVTGTPAAALPLTGGTLSGNVAGLSLTGTPIEDVYAITGTSVALEPDNGSIQTHTLSGNTTYTDAFSSGQAITLMIDDGSAYTVTWPTMTWVNNAGAAPTLALAGYTVVAVWKVSTVLYGALVGAGA
jgi:hypothetical protein